MLDIKGSVAVITGGGGGIGFSIAKYWVENGGKVVIADISEELLNKGRGGPQGHGRRGRIGGLQRHQGRGLRPPGRHGHRNLRADQSRGPFCRRHQGRDDGLAGPRHRQGHQEDGPGRFQAGRGHQPDRRVSHRARMRREDDQPQLPRPDLPRLLHRLPGHRRPDQLLVHQGGHVRHAQRSSPPSSSAGDLPTKSGVLPLRPATWGPTW